MRVRRFGWLLTLMSVSLAIACGGGSSGTSGGAGQSMTGRWTGSASAQGAKVGVDLTLVEEADGSISGSATVDLGKLGSGTGTVTGTHSDPDVTLIVTATDFSEVVYEGTFTGANTVVGTATSEGIPGISLKITRH